MGKNMLTRGQLARACGIGIEAIRFYERQGLLPKPPRSAAGYRYFPADSIDRLNFIRRAKQLGFSLKEIAELLSLHEQSGDRSEVKALALSKLAEIETRLRDLQNMQQALSKLVEQCSGHGSVQGCPIIHALVNSDRFKPEESADHAAPLPQPSARTSD